MAHKSSNVPAPVTPHAFSPTAWLWGLLFLHLGLSPILFSYATVEAFDYPKSLLLQLVGFLVLAWMIVGARHASPSGLPGPLARLTGDPLAAGVLLFGASALLSTAFSISPRTSLAGAPDSFAGLPTLLAGVVLFFATRAACGCWTDGRRLLLAPVLAACIAAAYALVQALGFDAFSWNRLSEREFLPLLKAFFRFGTVRPFSTLGNPNALGAFLAAVWPIEVCLAVHSRRRGRPYLATAFGFAALLGALAIVRSASRAGWFGLGLATMGLLAVLFAVSERRVPRKVVLSALALAATGFALLVILPAGRDLLDTLGRRLLGATGAGSRRYLWGIAFDLFREHPLTGTGVDTFGLAYSPRRTPEAWAVEWNTTFVRAHNELLQVLATQGAVAGVAVLGMLWGLGRSARAAWRNAARRNAASEDRLLLGGVFVAIVCLVPQASLGLLYTAPAVLLVTLAALVSVAAREGETSLPLEAAWTLRLSRGVALLAPVILLSNAAAWDQGLASGLVTLAAFGAPLIVLLAIRLPAAPVVAGAAKTTRRPPAASGAPASAYAGASVIAGMLALSLLYPAAAGSAFSARGMRLAGSDPEAALRSHERAVSLDSSHAPHWARLGQSAQAAAQRLPRPSGKAMRQRAREAFARASSLEPLEGRYTAFLCVAIADQASAGEATAAEAFAVCDQAIEKERANPYFVTAAVNAAVRLGDLPRARRLAEAGRTLYPTLGQLQYQLGFITLQEGRSDEATRLLSAAVQAEWHGQDADRETARKALDYAQRRHERSSASDSARR